MSPLENQNQNLIHQTKEIASEVEYYVQSQLCSELAIKRLQDSESKWMSIDCFDYSYVPNTRKDPLLQAMFKGIIEHGYKARLQSKKTHRGKEYFIQIKNENAQISSKCIIA